MGIQKIHHLTRIAGCHIKQFCSKKQPNIILKCCVFCPPVGLLLTLLQWCRSVLQVVSVHCDITGGRVYGCNRPERAVKHSLNCFKSFSVGIFPLITNIGHGFLKWLQLYFISIWPNQFHIKSWADNYMTSQGCLLGLCYFKVNSD